MEITSVFKCFRFKQRGNRLFKAKFYRNSWRWGSSLKIGDVVMHISDDFEDVDNFVTICDIVCCVTLKGEQGFYVYDA